MIRFDEVTKLYKGSTRPALNRIGLEILKGEFVFLVGASGSGKSSLLRLMLKEDRPSSGQIHVLGQRLSTLSARKVPFFRRNIGVVFQDFRLLPNKTVFDNVAFTLQVIGKSKGFIQQAVPDVLQLVGLVGKAGRLPHELSGGEQQRVAIARAIVNRPAILLADEPTGNLDPATSAGIMALLERINANGTTVVMATHDAGIVDRLQRRVVELVGGEMIRDERVGGYQTQAIPLAEVQAELEREAASTGRDRATTDAAAAPHRAAPATAPHHAAPATAPRGAAAVEPDAVAEATRAARQALGTDRQHDDVVTGDLGPDDWEWRPSERAAQSAPIALDEPAAPEAATPEPPTSSTLDDLEDTILRPSRRQRADEGEQR